MRYTEDHVSTFDAVKYRKERRIERAELGLCTRCDRPRVEGKADCQECLDETEVRAKEWRDGKRKAGVCISCGNPSESKLLRCDNCSKRLNESSRLRQKEIKTAVLMHYGKDGRLQCCWNGCKTDDLDMLTLDHIENDGAEHRKRYTKTGRGGGAWLYDMLIRNGFSDGFQTLCANHNLKKHMQNIRSSKGNRP